MSTDSENDGECPKAVSAGKRVVIFAGHYGSGKTNIALNCARALKRAGEVVAVGDLDIVNPYFRTKDSAADLAAEGIGLVVSDYANSNVDFPAMPKELYSLVTDRSRRVVLDVGGDDRGALALGRYVPDLVAENDYDFLAVINAARPLTRTPEDTVEVLREIESAAGLRFTGLVNNTNVGRETTPETVLASQAYAEAVASATGLPVVMTCASERVARELAGRIPNLLPLTIQKLYYQLDLAGFAAIRA